MNPLLEIVPEYRAALQAAGLGDFEGFMRVQGSGPPASRHAHRETVPLEIVIDGKPRAFFLKRVFRVPPRHAVAPLLRLRRGVSQPRHEWAVLWDLERAGVSAMKRVAFGERRVLGVPREAFLLVEKVPCETTLRHLLVPGWKKGGGPGESDRRRLFEAVGALMAGFHRLGMTWPDIDAKHIFACRASEEPLGWRLWMVDVERMTRGGRDSASTAHDGAVRLAVDGVRLRESLLPCRLTRRDMLHFGRGYLDAIDVSAGVLSAAELRSTARLFGEWMNPPRLPEDHVHPGARTMECVSGVFATPEARSLLKANGIHGLEDVFGPVGGKRLGKPGLATYRERVRLILRDATSGERVCYLKRYDRPPLREQLRRMREHDPRDSTAKREAHFIKHLSRIGVPTMRALAWGQDMSGRWERRSFLITEELAGESLEKLALRAESDPTAIPRPRERHEIIRQLAILVRHLHRHRYFHRDLYLCHVFISRNTDGGIVLRLIDLARMIERPVFIERWVLKDLAALDYSSPSPVVTRADRIRFLYHYQWAGARRLRKERAREIIRLIAARTRRMARHDANRRRRRTERHAT